jgi:hypothetical protein
MMQKKISYKFSLSQRLNLLISLPKTEVFMASRVHPGQRTWWNQLESVGSYLKERAEYYYDAANTEGAETPKRLLAFTRGCVQIGSVVACPWQAVYGAIASAAVPEPTKGVTEFLDAMITGLWNKMTLKQKVVATLIGVPITIAGYEFLVIPAALFSAKVGAELVYKNYKKEQIAELVRKATAEELPASIKKSV